MKAKLDERLLIWYDTARAFTALVYPAGFEHERFTRLVTGDAARVTRGAMESIMEGEEPSRVEYLISTDAGSNPLHVQMKDVEQAATIAAATGLAFEVRPVSLYDDYRKGREGLAAYFKWEGTPSAFVRYDREGDFWQLHPSFKLGWVDAFARSFASLTARTWQPTSVRELGGPGGYEFYSYLGTGVMTGDMARDLGTLLGLSPSDPFTHNMATDLAALSRLACSKAAWLEFDPVAVGLVRLVEQDKPKGWVALLFTDDLTLLSDIGQGPDEPGCRYLAECWLSARNKADLHALVAAGKREARRKPVDKGGQ